ncbi:hypothetical protein [Micromonospora sp. NPDC004551]|uniref:hypothetical protein n=1 Tax=Micromonospora sp. NPDC004551 TaxID=3154284 RepID=UPI0033BEF90B
MLVEARRRNRRRARLVGAAAGAAAVLATIGAAAVVRAGATTPITAAGSGCVVDQLDIPAGTTGGVVANGVDPSGRYVIGLAGTRDAPQAVLWTGGTVRVLPAFAPQAVSAAGLVVGFTGPVRVQYGDEKRQRPVVYDGTRLVPLPLPDGGLGGVAYAVNTHGDVLGTVVRADGSSAAVRWRTTGTIAIVSTVAGASGLGLNDDGVAVGFGMPLSHALRWAADGVTTALPVPHGVDSATALATAGDWAVGDAQLRPTDNKDDLMARAAVRWNLRTGAVELISGIGGRRVSASGTVAGTTSTDAPALWRNGRIFALPLPAGGMSYGSSVSGITADGHSLVGGVEVSAGAISTSGPAGDPVASDRTVPVVWRGC